MLNRALFNLLRPAGLWILAAAVLAGLFCFGAFAFGGEKVLDLGEIEITGEVRRPNINLIYSKKYFDEAMTAVAKRELKALEGELLKPAPPKKAPLKRKGPEKQP